MTHEDSDSASGQHLPAPAFSMPGYQAQMSPALAASWRRCQQRGISRSLAAPLPPPANLPQQGESTISRTLSLVRPVLEDIHQFVEGSRTVIGFADAEARLLDLVGDQALLEELRSIGWSIGSCWSEECTGANALALALIESFSIQVIGDAHYCNLLTPYCTAAAPVHDSLGGLIGALVVVAPAAQSHLHTLGMANAAAAALTSELRMNLWLGSANERLAELTAILQNLSEGVLLLEPDTTITQMNARAGHLLGLVPARVTGQRMANVIEMPMALRMALQSGRQMQDEEMAFRVNDERRVCVCSLRAIATPTESALMPGHATASSSGGSSRTGKTALPIGINVLPRTPAHGFVLTLRSIERVQRLVHRMSGAQARMSFDHIAGQSPELLEALRLARIAAESASTVLLHGETGTGKEVFAQSIHTGSARASGPFVAINCAAIPRELISSELFGYEGGAFTGADRHGRPGKFELANTGTLFLDEIGDMPPDLQASLLRAIETRSVMRVGGQQVIPVDVRIIAATHKDLTAEVAAGNFRSDLFFRLNVFPIEIPALRERAGDLEYLLRHILQRLSTRLDRPLGIEPDALRALEAYEWPGNVRELENVIERGVYISQHGIIALRDLPEIIQSAGQQLEGYAATRSQHGGLGITPQAESPGAGWSHRKGRLRSESENAEAIAIERALRSSGGNISEAARILGISRTTLWRKTKHHRRV